MQQFSIKAQTVLWLVAAVAPLCMAQAPAANPNRPASPPARRTGGGAGVDYKAYDEATLERGKKTYTANCAFCHGGNAKGGETGPDLLRSITVLHDENSELIGQVISNGRVDKGMPKFNLTPEQISDISAFLHDGVRAAAQRSTYKILDILVGDPKAGQAYFNGAGKCTTCHSASADLAPVGSKYDTVNLQQKIVMPREGRAGRGGGGQPNKSTAVTATVVLASGETVSGVLDHLDDFAVSVVDKNGDLRSFARDNGVPKVTLTDPMKGHLDLLKQYSDSDIHNLTAYLVTLK